MIICRLRRAFRIGPPAMPHPTETGRSFILSHLHGALTPHAVQIDNLWERELRNSQNVEHPQIPLHAIRGPSTPASKNRSTRCSPRLACPDQPPFSRPAMAPGRLRRQPLRRNPVSICSPAGQAPRRTIPTAARTGKGDLIIPRNGSGPVDGQVIFAVLPWTLPSPSPPGGQAPDRSPDGSLLHPIARTMFPDQTRLVGTVGG